MSRAVLLGTNAYPYLIVYWMELCKRFWYDEIDTIYIAVSQPVHPTAWPWVSDYLKSHDKVKLYLTGHNWPQSLNEVAQEVTEDHIFIPHDDTFIFKPGVVDSCFRYVESTNQVLSTFQPIYTPCKLVEDLLVKKYPRQVPVPQSDGSKAYSFYANFTYLSKELFDKTRKDFGEYHLKIGQYDPLLDVTAKQYTIDADTNFILMLDLLAAGAIFQAVPRSMIANLYNLDDPLGEFKRMRDEETGPFDPGIGWVHLQTMAYHIGGLYWDIDELRVIEKSAGPQPPKMKNEWGFRGKPSFIWDKTFKIALVYEFMETTGIFSNHRYQRQALLELDWIIRKYNLHRNYIKTIKKTFHELFWNKFYQE